MVQVDLELYCSSFKVVSVCTIKVVSRIPIDENHWYRGCVVVSMCSLCCTATETSDHLFLSCPFSIAIKNWLQDDLSCSIDHTSFESMINICSRGWSKQIEDIVLASVLNMIWAIWRCRNQVHFHDKCVHLASAINSTIAAISLTKNISSVSMTSSVAELLNLKRFLVAGHPHQAPMIKQVTLIPPIANWVKCNINGAVKGAPR